MDERNMEALQLEAEAEERLLASHRFDEPVESSDPAPEPPAEWEDHGDGILEDEQAGVERTREDDLDDGGEE